MNRTTYSLSRVRAWAANLGFAVLTAASSGCGPAKPASDGGVDPLARAQLSLRAESGAVPAGAVLTLAVDLAVPEGWHTYWENPGETGMAPEFRWLLPAGWRLEAVHYPVPERFEDEGIVSLGYQGETRILVDFATDPTASGEARVAVEADWMICREVCIPVESRAELAVRVEPRATTGGGKPAAFQAARDRLPRSTPEWQVALTRTADALELRIVPTGVGGPTAEEWPTAQVFATKRGLMDLTTPLRWTRDGDAWIVRLPPGPTSLVPGEAFDALIVVSRAGISQGWRITAPAPE